MSLLLTAANILFTLQAAIGLAAGLAVAPILGVLQGPLTRQVPLAAMAAAALLILALPSLEPFIGLSRADKLQALIYGSVAIAVIVLVVGMVVRQPAPATLPATQEV